MDPPPLIPLFGASCELPGRIPVMILEDCSLFPHCLLPLNIFEPKYRSMLEVSLATHRMFCIGTIRPGRRLHSEPETETGRTSQPLSRSVYRTSTAAIIRACVRQPDGTSRLVLQGLQRIQLNELRYDDPFATAKPVPLPDAGGNGEDTLQLSNQVRMAASGIADVVQSASEHLAEFLHRLRDPSALADIVAFHFIPDAHQRQPLLAMADVGKRLQLLLAMLSSQGPEGIMI